MQITLDGRSMPRMVETLDQVIAALPNQYNVNKKDCINFLDEILVKGTFKGLTSFELHPKEMNLDQHIRAYFDTYIEIDRMKEMLDTDVTKKPIINEWMTKIVTLWVIYEVATNGRIPFIKFVMGALMRNDKDVDIIYDDDIFGNSLYKVTVHKNTCSIHVDEQRGVITLHRLHTNDPLTWIVIVSERLLLLWKSAKKGGVIHERRQKRITRAVSA